jgi:hypothetical protein
MTDKAMGCICGASGDNPSEHKLDCMFYANNKPKLVGGLATSSQIPGFKYIPRQALVALASIFDEGNNSHGEKSWNGLSPNFNAVNHDMGFLQERLSHAIDHASKALAELSGQCPVSRENHAGALMFAGAVLACSTVLVKGEVGGQDAPVVARKPVSIIIKEVVTIAGQNARIIVGDGHKAIELPAMMWGEANNMCKLLEEIINGR